MFSYYTDLVCNGSIGQVNVQAAPEPLEVVLGQRGIEKQQRSGLERFMPAMFAYDLPPSRRAASDVTPASPLRVPMVACQLSERETHDLMAFGRAHRLGLNGLLSAAAPVGGVADSWQDEYPGALRVSGRFTLRPLTPAVCDRVHKPLGSGHLSCRDRPQHRCGKPRPGHRRDFSRRSVRWGDPAIAAALQPAICR